MEIHNQKKPPSGNFFIIPNCIFKERLKARDLAVYCYLMYCADRVTFDCYPARKTIAEACGMPPPLRGDCSRVCSNSRNQEMITMETKKKYAYFQLPSQVEQMDKVLPLSNCVNRSDFVRTAIDFYIGYILQSQNADYLSPMITSVIKNEIQHTVDELLRHIVNENRPLQYMYARWNEVNRLKLALYYDSENDKDIPIETNKEFRSLKNMLIKAVLEMQINTAENRWQNSKGNESLYNGILQSIASLFNSKAADRINEINAQKRQQTDSRELSKEQQKRIAHGERSIGGEYTKVEKDEEDSRRAAENAEALFNIGAGIIDFALRRAIQQQLQNTNQNNDTDEDFDEGEGFGQLM